jgi:GDP-L-fucose synthase
MTNSSSNKLHGKVIVAGHRGMVGKAVVRKLEDNHDVELLLAARNELDLTNQPAVDAFFDKHKPDIVIFCAAKVGGIYANMTYPVEFLTDNLLMSVNVTRAAYENRASRLLYLGSTCIYPRNAPQPIQERALLSDYLEKTNEAYALAKITGLKLCEYYRRQYGAMFHSAMPTNMYGPGDNYHPDNSHVLPALIRRFHEAKLNDAPEVTIWGTGTPRREFMHVDDLADAIVHLVQMDDPPDLVNVGTGEDVSILEVATIVAATVGYQGKIVTDPSKPDGTPRKVTDMTLMHSLGWKHKISLEQGLNQTYKDFLSEYHAGVMRTA